MLKAFQHFDSVSGVACNHTGVGKYGFVKLTPIPKLKWKQESKKVVLTLNLPFFKKYIPYMWSFVKLKILRSSKVQFFGLCTGMYCDVLWVGQGSFLIQEAS